MSSAQVRLKTVVADDEPLARELLQSLVERDPQLELVAAASNGKEALAAAASRQPDLLLLDIEMPCLSGIAVAEQVASLAQRPYLIFVTAHDEFAVKAFEVAADDYLVKPVSKQRFEQAIRRAKEKYRRRQLGQLAAQLTDLRQDIPSPETDEGLLPLTVRCGERMVRLEPTDLVWVEAANQYSRLHVDNGDCHLVSQSLRQFSGQLPASLFVRIHRSTMINLQYLEDVLNTRGSYQAKMSSGDVLNIARNRRSLVSMLLDRVRQNTRHD